MLRQNQSVTDTDVGPLKVSDRDTCVSVYLSFGIHTFSLLPDVTALANHLAAFIPPAAFDLLLMPWMFSSNVCWPSALENS